MGKRELGTRVFDPVGRVACRLQNRCSESVTDVNATTCDTTDPALTALLTYFEQKSPDLARVVEAWDNLPEPVRAGIVAMVQASRVTRE